MTEETSQSVTEKTAVEKAIEHGGEGLSSVVGSVTNNDDIRFALSVQEETFVF